MSKILIVSSHLDDIEIGMGGTALKLSECHDMFCVVMTDGNPPTRPAGDERMKVFNSNMDLIGMKECFYLGYRDQYLFDQDINECINTLNNILNQVKPDHIYTQNSDDVNVDHRITSEIVRVCTRPRAASCVNKLYEFNIPGSTEWNYKHFNFNTAVDITKYWPDKMEMISKYKTEIRPSPDPCSLDKIKSRDEYFGGVFGYDKAEVFKLIFDRC